MAPVIERYEHHGTVVAVQAHLKGQHREHCLCFQGCARFHPNTPSNCQVADTLFEFDKRHGMVTPVFECPWFECSENAAQL